MKANFQAPLCAPHLANYYWLTHNTNYDRLSGLNTRRNDKKGRICKILYDLANDRKEPPLVALHFLCYRDLISSPETPRLKFN